MFGKKKQEVKQEEQPRTETIIVKGLDEKSQGVNMPIPPAPPKRDTLGEILWPEFTKDFMYWNTEDLIRMTEAEKEVMKINLMLAIYGELRLIRDISKQG